MKVSIDFVIFTIDKPERLNEKAAYSPVNN